MSFGQWLKTAREAADLTQLQVAERAGCTKAYISALERDVVGLKRGRTIQPGLDFVDSIARAMRANPDEARLAAGYAPKQKSDVEQSEIESSRIAALYYRAANLVDEEHRRDAERALDIFEAYVSKLEIEEAKARNEKGKG